ncbi:MULTISPECIES: SCP2 sterol-binding domain-containing protein [Thiorhodovibrio]|uniref:SCP2 sterol-binding domain-containing protein n=1 Tax=Thiorhodovibrio TaxID=61593 RepID=UPI00191329F6|nr:MULTISPECIES: SCP2 sterol-binding domain-containing protein [Thiorhodovibrio]MBK5970026.1 sterol-binding protein [Thiorhodovibrio winogradskyi]WPL12953.1 Putative sterol carrier protein [Thiorhodovibrio litoralis]
MKQTKTASLIIGGLFGLTALGVEASVFMDQEWAKQACEAWNQNATLTGELGDGWIDNDEGRGFKTIQMYRTKCGLGSKVELKIESQNGKATCTYGGAVTNTDPDYGADYLMYASDEDWTCMGEGKSGCGAMGAMMSGKLKFSGPKMEAMGVMGPFNDFLVLTGTLGGDKASCP